MNRRAFVITGAMATTAGALKLRAQPPEHRIRLSALRPRFANHGWGSLFYDSSVDGRKMQVVDRQFDHGVSTHARSDLVYLAGGRYSRFVAWVGVDVAPGRFKDGTAIFQVFADGRKLYDSGVMRPDTPARRVDVYLGNPNVLRLVVTYVGSYADHANWADAELELAAGRATAAAGRVREDRRLVKSGGHTFEVAGGALAGWRMPNGKRLALRGTVGLGPNTHGPSAAESVSSLTGAPGGLRWEWRHASKAESAWTAPVDTVFTWPSPGTATIWLPWGHGWTWEDPLTPRPFTDQTYEYGAFFNREFGLSLPMATVIDEANGIGVSFIQSPDDVVIDMQVATTRSGEIRFSRAFNRFGGGAPPVSFNMDVVIHEPDVRAALRAIVDRYPQYFDPPNSLTHDVGGLGAYSGWEGGLNAGKLQAMGFTMNWKASLDFPYMGVFLPPLKDDVKWNRFAGGGSGVYTAKDEGRYGEATIRGMRDYSTAMRAQGFFVLNYFNVTEFGGNIVYPPPAQTTATDGEMWKDANAYLHGAFEGAVLKTPLPIWTWGKAVIMDCGDPAYRSFLLDQARRHVAELPDSSGICIDRMDWLTRYNPNADDGVTWIDGINRHLRRSWMALMDEMGPIFHNANKVIYANDMDRRLELMRHVDGFYDEHAHFPFNLNTSAFLALRKPLVCWTPEENPLAPDPDSYFQRHLYLGGFPTVPYTGNDHTVLPSEENERHYLAYGPMMRAMRGRAWVLEPGVVEVEGGVAKANVFTTKAGHVVFVGLAAGANRMRLTLRGVGLQARLLHPGAADGTLAGSGDRAKSTWEVPLVRGCAMLVIGA